MKIAKIRLKKTLVTLTLFALGVVSGVLLHRLSAGAERQKDPGALTSGLSGEKTEVWTCSMHPNIQLPKQGKCPICFMDLIPRDSGDSGSGDERVIELSEYAAKLIEIETTPVERRFAAAEVRMSGKVDFDETRISYISAWVPGRLDRLYVNYTGIPVEKGDHLAEIYSPELLVAGEELLLALRVQAELKKSGAEGGLRMSDSTVDAAREKLRLLGLDVKQIQELENSGASGDHITIHSPANGIVIDKNAHEGMYVQTGTRIYTIADISRVWVKLDVYESDISRIKYGGTVEFTAESYPGEKFSGWISFIDPVITSATRTVKVRVVVHNADGRLKPGMFVRAVARPRIAESGRVVSSDLAGKWISPMHPEVVKDAPGACDVCGMPLVTAESLGYVDEQSEVAPLLVPATAALKTGKRAVVYVKISGSEQTAFEGREVELGARLGNFYIVKEGLEAGDLVVTRGAFKLDAEMQIRARPSMMSVTGDTPDEMRQSTGRADSQTLCPVMGNPINKDVYADYKGMRIYFCCKGCDATFMKDPDTYIAKMRAEGIEPEKTGEGHAH